MDIAVFKLEIFLPPSHFDAIRAALDSVDAGHIGNYASCLSVSEVQSQWRPLEGCDPFLGHVGELSVERELKVEVSVRAEKLEETIAAVKAAHPYEEPVVNVIPLWATGL